MVAGGMALALAPVFASAQQPLLAVAPPKTGKHTRHSEPAKPQTEPAYSIEVGPLGFAPPAPFYLGSRRAQVSIDFLDENHLLFTFRVPGLIQRENKAGVQFPDDEERHIRAVVLDLPSGQVLAEALWTVHDLAPYLVILKGGRFLLRDRNTVEMGDSGLRLHPFLRFPGKVTYFEIDPSQRFLVANTSEPAQPEGVETASAAGVPGNSGADTGTFPSSASNSSQALIRILDMDTRDVKLFGHVTGAIHLPVGGEGYFEALRGSGTKWTINYHGFHGDSAILQQIDSTCSPTLDAVASGVVLAAGCTPGGPRRLTAITREPQALWDLTLPQTKIYPHLYFAVDAGRFARSTIDVTHPVDTMNPLDGEDMRSQSVQVYDLADGQVKLSAAASPVLDGGGNFALSPSGQSFAVLNAGFIEIYHLQPAPSIPEPAAVSAAHDARNDDQVNKRDQAKKN
jgi:hypothetical protein